MMRCARPAVRIVVLSAGHSTRLGMPKALARVHGATLLRRTLRVLQPVAAPWNIIVVIPPAARRYRIAAAGLAATFVPNPARGSGLSSSIRVGIRSARHSAGTLLVPVDFPGLGGRDIARLVRRWNGCRRKVVARRVDAGAATPLVLPHWLYRCAFGLRGDQGLRDVVRRLPTNAVRLVALPSAEADIDTPADLERARRRFHPWLPRAC